MTIAAYDNEIWAPEDGAPQGVMFDVKVHSRSRDDLSYRIARDRQGVIWHTRACESWKHRGPGVCSHVRQAIEMAENTEVVFLERVRWSFESYGGALMSGDDIRSFWAEAHAALIELREIRFGQLHAAGVHERMKGVTHEHAAAVFDRGPEGASRRMGSAMRAMNRRGR